MLHSSVGLFVLCNEIVEFREILIALIALIALIIPRALIIPSVPIILKTPRPFKSLA